MTDKDDIENLEDRIETPLDPNLRCFIDPGEFECVYGPPEPDIYGPPYPEDWDEDWDEDYDNDNYNADQEND